MKEKVFVRPTKMMSTLVQGQRGSFKCSECTAEFEVLNEPRDLSTYETIGQIQRVRYCPFCGTAKIKVEQ